jgi:hypothetical protein
MKKQMSKYQVHTKIRNRELSAIQIEKLKKIIITLANYIFLDRETLNYFAEEKIGLSYLQIATSYNIIIETQNQKEIQKKEEFYFELGENGLYIITLDQIERQKLAILISREEKEKILNFNRFLMKRNEKIEYKVIDSDYNIFGSEQLVYYYDLINEIEIINCFREKIIKKKEKNETVEKYFYENYNLIKIQKNKIKIFGQTKKTY